MMTRVLLGPSMVKVRFLITVALVFFLVSLWASLSHSLAAQGGKQVYRVGIDQEYEPFEFLDESGQANGLTPALLRVIGAAVGVSFEFVPMPWPQVVEALENGQVDLVNMIYSPARAEHYLFAKPHSQIVQAIFRHSEAKDIGGPSSLAGHRVGLQEADIALTHLGNRTDFQQRLFTSKLEGLLHLNMGEVDAFVCAQQAGIHLIAEYHLSNITLAEGKLFPQQYAFVALKGQERLISMLNQQLVALDSEGALQRLRDTWLTGHLPRPSWMEKHKALLVGGGGATLALLFLMALWNATLSRLVRLKTQTLQQSEEKFRQLAEHIEEVFWMTDPEKNTVLYVSPAYETIWGRSVESLYASPRDWIEAIHPEDRQCILQRATTEQVLGDYTAEFRIIRPDGAVRWIYDQAFPIRDNAGTIYRVVGVAIDITERKHAEETVRTHRQQLKTIIEALPDAVFLKDSQGRWQIINTAAQDLFRLAGLPWENKNDLELIAAQPEMEFALRRGWESDEQAWRAGGMLRFEEFLPCLDGDTACYDVIKVPLFDMKGLRHRLVVGYRDISERKRLEDSLIEQEKELCTIFEHVPLVMLLVNSDRRIRRANRAATEFTGLSESDMLGQRPGTALSCVHAHDVPEGCGAGPFCQRCQVRRLILETLTNQEPHMQQEVRHQFILAGKQRDLTLFVSTAPVMIRQEPMVLVSLQDVTEYKTLEGQLQQAQKMESLGTLAGGIAHDFNNILSAIIGYTDLALLDCRDNPSLTTSLQEVRQAGNRATALVRQILTFSRKEPHETVPLQISLIAKEALKLLRATIPTTIAIRQEITSQATVLADPTQIHQLLINLCTNAYHAMQERSGGGELRVSLADLEMERPEVIDDSATVIPPGSYVVLTVSDTGCGMDRETVDRIFEPYFTTKGQGKGTGLGLSVVHGIVRGHYGYIAVISVPGQGTTFTVYLPVMQDHQATAPDGAIDFVVPQSRFQERIMVVDDEDSIRDVQAQILKQAGFLVDLFSNGVNAWEALVHSPDAWDLILTDQTMPGMTGLQLAAQVKGLRPLLPIVLCSGNEATFDSTYFQEDTLFFPLKKPVDRDRLLLAVAKALDHGREAAARMNHLGAVTQ